MAINRLNLPNNILAAEKTIITTPDLSRPEFKDLTGVEITITNANGTVHVVSEWEKVTPASGKGTSASAKTLALKPGSDESKVQVTAVSFTDKNLHIDLLFKVADEYELVVVAETSKTRHFFESGDVTVFSKPKPKPAAGTGGTSPSSPSGIQRVSLVEPNRFPTEEDQIMWRYIRNGTLNFNVYKRFVDEVMFPEEIRDGKTYFPEPIPSTARNARQRSPMLRTDAYGFLKQATDFFMDRYFYKYNVEPGKQRRDPLDNTQPSVLENPNGLQRREDSEFRRTLTDLPDNTPDQTVRYFEQVLSRLPDVPQEVTVQGIGSYKPFQVPNLTLLELIWSYWHEEGGLVQTMNAISMRFQNIRGGNGHDPLAGLNIDPLRPLNNLIWGYIQDERFRLSLAQRNFEYQYEYGLSLIGRAVPTTAVAETRSQFIPAFHNLLKATTDFYLQANYTTVIPDGFPILNHLREVHLLLAEGAHNAYRDLPYTARVEMMTQQWILARPEMREFLGGRISVPYAEPWMDRIDTMKTLQGWDPANVTHFHDLGRFGEQLLLSIRYGAWNDPGTGALVSANWAHNWREEIQRYIHAYKAVTGVDLAADVTDARISLPQQNERYEQPAVLMNRRANALPAVQGQLGFGALTRQRTLRENR